MTNFWITFWHRAASSRLCAEGKHHIRNWEGEKDQGGDDGTCKYISEAFTACGHGHFYTVYFWADAASLSCSKRKNRLMGRLHNAHEVKSIRALGVSALSCRAGRGMCWEAACCSGKGGRSVQSWAPWFGAGLGNVVFALPLPKKL